jgi:hypothetical protein
MKKRSKARAQELRDDARSYDDADIPATRGSRRITGDSSSMVVLEFRDLLISAKFGGIAMRKTRSCLFA